MKHAKPLLAVLAALIPLTASAADRLDEAAGELARRALIVDTHIDVPYRLSERWEDVTGRTENGEFDYVRAREGGLDVPFMSIYTPAESEADGTSFQLANVLIDNVEALVGRAPDRFAVVRSPAEAREAFAAGKVGLALGMENGSPIAGELETWPFSGTAVSATSRWRIRSATTCRILPTTTSASGRA